MAPGLQSSRFLAENRAARIEMATLSGHIYLVHWLVYPPLADINRPLAVAGSLVAGIAYWTLCNRCTSTFQWFRNRSKQQQ